MDYFNFETDIKFTHEGVSDLCNFLKIFLKKLKKIKIKANKKTTKIKIIFSEFN